MNPHEVLGVDASATPSDIKSAYRRLAMEHHPDRNENSEESVTRFREIQDAYDMLRTDKPRQNPQHEQHYHHHQSFDMGDMFEQFFRRQQMGNPSMQAHCEITLQQAFEGCTMSFDLPTGKIAAVDIPAGVDHGQVLKIEGGAGAPDPNYPAGDLHIVVRLRPHNIFGRQGMTLLTRVPVDLLEMICGSEQEITTLTGETVKYTIPENSHSETVITIKEQGMNRVGSDERGDLILHLMPRFPEFTDKQLKALRKVQKLDK